MQPSHFTSNTVRPAEQSTLESIERMLLSEDEQEAPPSAHSHAYFQSFAELTRPSPSQTASVPPSPAQNPISSDDQIEMIQQFFYYKGIPDFANLHCSTIKRRLKNLNLPVERLIEILSIADTPNHPTLVNLGISQLECGALITLLSDIFNSPTKLSYKIRNSAEVGQNNSHDFIAALIAHVRNDP